MMCEIERESLLGSSTESSDSLAASPPAVSSAASSPVHTSTTLRPRNSSKACTTYKGKGVKCTRNRSCPKHREHRSAGVVDDRTKQAMPLRWNKEETVIAVYFSSRYLRCSSISQLMVSRGYERTPSAIERKLRNIRQAHPNLQLSHDQWDVDAVDQWVDDLLFPKAVAPLIWFSAKDAEIVARNQSVEQTLQAFCDLEYRWCEAFERLCPSEYPSTPIDYEFD